MKQAQTTRRTIDQSRRFGGMLVVPAVGHFDVMPRYRQGRAAIKVMNRLRCDVELQVVFVFRVSME